MKRVFAMVLSLLLIFSACFFANAADTGNYSTGEKTVIKMNGWAYVKNGGYGYYIDEYYGDSDEPSVPWTFAKEHVNAIGEYAFSNNASITSVKTTGAIESIGNYAFDGCTSLNKVALYSALTTLGTGTFYGDSALKTINIHDTSITAVSAYCFAECGITHIALPETCASIGNNAFYNCSNLRRVTIPESVTSIADNAFSGCDNLLILCASGSYAAQYAETNGLNYVTTDSFVVGDANGDNNVTIRDVTYIQLYLVNLYTLEGNTVYSADVNADGKVNIRDATYIQMYRAGMISGFDNIT